MSLTAVIVLNSLFVAAVVTGLVYVCRAPYRLGALVGRSVGEIGRREETTRERLAA